MTIPDLKGLTKPVQKELKLFEIEFEKVLRSDVFLINTITRYILSQKSKRIRPILLMLCAKLCGEPNEYSYLAATLIEVLHTATLIHDDIVDDADTRRGLPSINAIWKNKISVLLGDYLFSKSLINMVRLKDFEALELLSKTSEMLSSGEILQIEKSFTNGMSEEIYFAMIKAKTASLFAAGCELGALSVNSSKEERKALYKYGEAIGMVFQIKDDLFDFLGSKFTIGKPVSRDIKKNMMTLPLIYSLNQVSHSERRRVRKVLKQCPSKEEIQEITTLVEDTAGVDYAKKKVDEISEVAINQLSIFSDSEVKQSLIDFTIFNKYRTK